MKLGRANEKAHYAGRDALLQRGAIVHNVDGTKYEVLHVRGSTVTVKVLLPWWKRLYLRIRRRPTPGVSGALGGRVAVK